MLPAAPPGGASPLAPAIPRARVPAPPHDPVLLALPPSAASAAVLRALRADGLGVGAVSDGLGVLDAVRARQPALLVLDAELPGAERTLSAVQREAGAVPVVLVLPRERRADVLGRLRPDRDDYVLRPFAVDDLAARIRLRMGALPGGEQGVVRRGELTVDVEYGDVTVDGQHVALSPTEYSLLMSLVEASGEVVGPDRLAHEVWSEPKPANLVQVYISYLRRKIGPERIRTVRGEGYVLEP